MTAPANVTERGSIVVRGVRVHNLKNIDFEIPHQALTIVTGVSGSGKSSLAFDTVYAEGQRRYIESLSAYARQFLERIEKPEIDEVTGIAPAIAIRQRNTARTPRSTVGTSTEIYDYLRLLFARVGETRCRQCGQPVRRDTVDRIADAVLAWPADTRFYVLCPLRLPADAEERAAILADLKRRGFTRIYQDGRTFEYSTPESLLDLDFDSPAFTLVDRLKVAPDIRQRLIDSVETCFRESNGEVFLETVGTTPPNGGSTAGQRFRFSEAFECKTCDIRYEPPEPHLFSFNSPFGACPRCQGFGNTVDLDMDLAVPDRSLSLDQGAVEPWTKPRYRAEFTAFKKSARAAGVRTDVPYRSLSERDQTFVMNAIRKFFDYLERKKYKLHVRVFLSRYRGYTTCPECGGSRLRQEALAVYVGEKNVADVCRMTIGESHRFFDAIRLGEADTKIAERILWEIRSRLRFLNDVGLEYLTLDRLSSTLSGGEAQRIQLATSLGSSLVGALYVLDEPSIGLHPRDGRRLIDILLRLRDIGNTVLVVEHDAEIIRSADHILDLGPGAGENGGQVVYQGTLEGIRGCPTSLTGKYLGGELQVAAPRERRKPGPKTIRLAGASKRNLKDIRLEIPIGLMTCITGVSGSGKSTLVHECLYESLQAAIRGGDPPPGAGVIESGTKWISDVVLVDQSPIGRTPRSNPVTYIKAFDHIREVFAGTREAQARGYNAGSFSFNIPGGRCEVCEGDGTVTVEMQFLADVELICEECKGTRYKAGVLEVLYKGKSIYDTLRMTVREALAFFSNVPRIAKKLRPLDEVGLGYLRLGQSATTLSGGEAQRIKLASYLARETSEKTLFIFDEPTTGLHFDDINKLLIAFRRLIETGGTVLIVEHNLDVIKSADWVIDLGPEGGEAGGNVVCVGPPDAIALQETSWTGRFLRHALVL
ncbi:MAG TPA: excinuclease ABC subunit UvrA [Terriglobia bacterium]|nr:excinuclease ABC subunit UvrA [Terriglobia bacterium]